MDHFELQAVGVLEEDRVVARPVFRVLTGTAVERRDAAGFQELFVEAIDVGAQSVAGAYAKAFVEAGVKVRGRDEPIDLYTVDV